MDANVLLGLLFLVCVANISICGAQNVTVWEFREDDNLSIEDSKRVKASYAGPKLNKSLKNFTLCFRYYISLFTDSGSGINIFGYVKCNYVPIQFKFPGFFTNIVFYFFIWFLYIQILFQILSFPLISCSEQKIQLAMPHFN